MNTTFFNSENGNCPDPYRSELNLTDEINLKKVVNILYYQILVTTIHWKT